MSRKLCFVDDDRDELDRFKRALASDDFVVGIGTTIDEARNDLRAQGKGRLFGWFPASSHADLFVLDMYYPTGGLKTKAQLMTLERAWEDFRVAEATLKNRLAELGQEFAGGRRLAQEASTQRSFIATPFVYFTRKGTLSDVIEAYEQIKALSVIKKPDPQTPVNEAERKQAYDQAMMEDRDNIRRALESALHRAGFWYRYHEFSLGVITGVVASFIFLLLTSWGQALLRLIG